MAQPQTKPIQAEAAQILRVVGTTPDALVVTLRSGPAQPWCVHCALPPHVVVAAGDEVVVLPSSDGPVAIALLRSPDVTRHALTDGTRISTDASNIAVERADGTPLFRYAAEAGRGQVTLAAEAIQLSATAGDLCFQAAGAIRMRGRALALESAMPGAEARLELTPRSARLSGDALALEGRTFTLDASEAELQGGELRGRFKRAVVTLERLDAVADVVVSRARNVYQSVQELLQQQAGSLRTLVTGAAQLRAREVMQRAEEAYKIRAEKIHLG